MEKAKLYAVTTRPETLFELGDEYIKESDWRDLALIKFCLCAMGMLLGLALPHRWKKPAAFGAMAVFVATYIPLMCKFFRILGTGCRTEK